MHHIQGIPETITVDYVKHWVEPRVTAKRFKHIVGVVKVAKDLADRHDCDVFLAEIGAWLHDACKEWKDRDLVAKARELGIPFGEIEESHGHLLHGPVAAGVAMHELGITHEELLAAIAEHTLGNVPMTKLSEVLFLADCLDETRSPEYTAPIWGALAMDSDFNVEKAMVTATDLGLLHLMETARPIHPRTVEVRNYYLARLKERASLSV